MKTRHPQLAALAALSIALAAARAPGAESETITSARRAIAEGVPIAAVEKLGKALASSTLSPAERTAAVQLLAEAQLEAQRPSDALATAQQLPAGDAAAVRLRANALMQLGKWDEALIQLRQLQNTGDEMWTRAGEAECLQAMGQTEEAAAALRPAIASPNAPGTLVLRLASLLLQIDQTQEARALIEKTNPSSATDRHWKRYLEARIQLSEKNPALALTTLEPLLSESGTLIEGLTASLHAAVALAEAEARLALGKLEIAEKSLEAFIRQNPESPHLETVFRRLDQIYSQDPSTDEGPLTRIATDMPPRAAALAQFYLPRIHVRAKRYDRAAEELRKFLTRFPDSSLTPYVHAALAEVAQDRGDLAEAEAALDAASRTATSDMLRGELALQTALLNLQQGEFIRASTGFRTAAQRSPALRDRAQYDSALAWLRQKNFERFAEELAAFVADGGNVILTGNLRLEEGLVRARTGDANATKSLRAFLTEFTTHPRRAEAHLALAELAFNGGDLASAEKNQEAVSTSEAAPETREHADYLGVFLEDAKTPAEDEKTIARARDFLHDYPTSAMRDEVRMKLGEVYFRREDFLNAQDQFETLARETPNSPLVSAALFLAGQSAMKLLDDKSLNRALELFGSVIEKHGPLEPHARLHQAIIKNRLGAPDDAVKIYDSILTAQPAVELDLRLAALTGKGDNLVVLGNTDPKQLEAAVEAYDQVITNPDASPTWRNQAAFKKGKALEAQKRKDEAFLVFYEVLDKTLAGPRETFWFAQAGFAAAATATERKEWKSAVGIYSKMASVPGPHAEEARQRARKLRLEHFLWE